MNKSESITNLAKALAIFHTHVGKVSKDAKNPFFKSKYASLPNILEAIREPLEKSGVVVSQFPSGVNGLSTILIHSESGEWMEDTYTMPVAKQNDPQAVGSAITYARRYALASSLGLNVDEDDDANAASQQPKPKAEPANPVTEYTKPIMEEVDRCKSKEDLAAVWKKYPELGKTNKAFKDDVTNKGISL